MRKLLLIMIALAGCQVGTEITPPAEAVALFQPHRVFYPFSDPENAAAREPGERKEEAERARQDAVWSATLKGGAEAIPVTRRLHESGPKADVADVIEQAEETFASCEPGSCYVTEQVIAYEMLNTYLAGGKLFTVTPDNFETADLSGHEQEAIAFALRVLTRNETYHAHLVAVALKAVGDRMLPEEKHNVAAQALRNAEAFLSTRPCGTCGSGKNASDVETEVRLGVVKLRALLDF